jgi:hypothetical protein
VTSIIEVTLDCADAARQAEFWVSALGYEVMGAEPGVAYLKDPDDRGPFLCLLEVPESKVVKNRMHFDLVVAGDGSDGEKWQRITNEVDRLQAFGATVRGEHPPNFVGMIDPEGNEFDVT